MSARSQMTQRALFQRDTSTGEDPYGRPTDPVWTVYLEDVPCKYWVRSDRELVATTTRVQNVEAVVQDARVIVPKIEVTTEDRIESIKDRLGNAMLGGPWAIEGIEVRSTHYELVVRAVR